MPRPYKQYLGDGAFVEYDGYALILTTEDGLKETNRIVLEDATFYNFAKFVQKLDAEKLFNIPAVKIEVTG